MHRSIIRSTFALAAVLALLALAVAPAAAQKPNTLHFVDHSDQAVADFNDCGEDLPLTVFTTGVLSGELFFDDAGNFLSITATFAGYDTITNTDTGLSATAEYDVRFRNSADVAVEGHPEQVGFYVTNTGTAKLRGPDGRVLWHGAGITRSFEVIIPNPDSSPTLVSEEILFQAGKLADGDFCQVLTMALGL